MFHAALMPVVLHTLQHLVTMLSMIQVTWGHSQSPWLWQLCSMLGASQLCWMVYMCARVRAKLICPYVMCRDVRAYRRINTDVYCSI